MRRHLLTVSLIGVLGVLLSASDASACHHRKKKAGCCAPAPQPCITVVYCPPPPPCPPPVPVCESKPVKHCGKCGGPRHGLFGGCHSKRAKIACAPAPCAPVPCSTPVVYAPPLNHFAVAPHLEAPMPQAMPYPPVKGTPQG